MMFLSITILALLSHAATEVVSMDVNSAVDNAGATAAAAAAAAPPQQSYSRHPMTRVMCSQQPKKTCYGFALDPVAEVDGVCGWSPSENKCAVVSIGEEPKEGTMCMMHRTLAACINGHPSGVGQQGAGMGMGMGAGMPGMGMGMATAMDIIDPIERVCAWNPYTGMCKDGQLEEEPGDFAFGAGSASGCAWGNPTALTCPMPLCRWSGTACVSSGLNFDWVRVTPLQKTHQPSTKTEKETSPWTLAAYSAGAFCVGLACATAIMRFGTRKTALSQFTQERLV